MLWLLPLTWPVILVDAAVDAGVVVIVTAAVVVAAVRYRGGFCDQQRLRR